MNLGSIISVDQRKQVAGLMAVALGLPTRDLCGLLIDYEGDLEPAKRQAIRASQAPQAEASVKTEHSRRAAQQAEAVHLFQDSDDDEIIVKIDPNESFLEWVDDTPPQIEQNNVQTRQNQSIGSNIRSKKPGSGRIEATKFVKDK